MRVTVGGLDLLVVLLFAIAGHASHYGNVTIAGVWGIAWPFALGALAGSAVLAVAGRAGHHLRSGLVLWPITLAVGMALRWLTGSGTAWSFVLVAIGVLGAGLLGWRAVATLVRLERAHRRRPSPQQGTESDSMRGMT